MFSIANAEALLLKKFPDYAVETSYANKNYFVFSLRHKSMPRGASTGGACYIVDKNSKQISVCLITDKRASRF